jgi:hypothetical protein
LSGLVELPLSRRILLHCLTRSEFVCFFVSSCRRYYPLGYGDRIIYTKNLALLFLVFVAADLTGNTQRSYEIYSVLLPICTVVTATFILT